MTGSASSKPAKISKALLCVDDDLDTLTLRKFVLEAAGYSVSTAASGENALRILAEGMNVDAVLLDYLMPGMNGDELAVKLREQYPQLPLIAVSAVGQLPETLLQVVNARVQKGQGPEVLLSTISAVLERPDQLQRNDRTLSKSTILCVDDEQSQLTARRLLFEAAGYNVIEARNAIVALEQFQKQHIDAVIMDYWLSGQNGTAIAEEMKRLRPRIPIIMLSGFTSLPGEGNIVDSWLRKADIEPEELINEVRRLIELRAPRR